MSKIRIGVVGVGNCASALIQGIQYYSKLSSHNDGFMHRKIGPYALDDIEISCAFDVDENKVGRRVAEAMFEPPNNTPCFIDSGSMRNTEVMVFRGPTLDGLGKYHRTLVKESSEKPVNVAQVLKNTKTDIVVNYLPVGSEKAAWFYAQEVIKAGCGFMNCMPCFIASTAPGRIAFQEANLPIIGDDIKSQLGATIVHRVLTNLFQDRGIKLERMYQTNSGGNTDFLSMLERDRLESKKISKTEAVQSQLNVPLPDEQIHVGPSDYIPWLKDNKICNIRMEGTGFGGAPIRLDVNMQVVDSPNSAGVVIDGIRCLKLAMDAGIGGVLEAPSAWFCKHPPGQTTDALAKINLERWLIVMEGCCVA